MQVFEDDDGGFNGYCYACDTFVPDPYKDKPPNYKPVVIKKSPEEVAQELWDIGQLPIVGVAERGLTKETLEYFGYRVGLSQADGESPAILYRPYTKDGEFRSYKSKILENKKTWSVGDQRDVDLFGWEQAIRSGSPKLIITEGEEDAGALYQMIRRENANTQWADLQPAAVSLPHGASGSVRDLSRLSAKIRQNFKEIILAFDMDEVGQQWAHQVVEKVFGEAKIANLPAKDANECLLTGRSKACVKAVVWQSSVPKNSHIVKGSLLREKARQKPVWGMPWPFPKLTALTRGRRRGETIYFGAGVKMGKSELVDAIAKQIIVDDQLPCLLIKPEQDPARTYKQLVGKAAGRIFHDPAIEFDEAAFDRAEPLIGDRALIMDSYQFVDWDNLKEDIRYSVLAEDVKDVIIDPITVFTNQMSSSEANEFLIGMAAELSAMTKDLDFTAYIFCHLKAPESGEPHERGGNVYSTQFAGSRAMMRSCNYMIGLQGNKDPNLDIDQRNFRELVLLEDREYGNVGKVRLWWDKHTGLFSEVA
ncbi:MAG: toprim domain-containing protein [Planctomycetes bacterium]|nr:toprim domain-containing protein [Planctomycetota bacterium]